MKNGKRAVAALLVGLLFCGVGTGCVEKQETLAPPEKKYVKWTKVADGEFTPFSMPEYMNATGLYVQRQGIGGPGDIYFADVRNGGGTLVKSGFDLEGEIGSAKALLEEKAVDLTGFSAQYLPKRNVLIMTANSRELWMYQLENGQLKELGNGSYGPMEYEDAYRLAMEKWGEGAYLYPYASVTPSPDEHFLAFSSGMFVDGTQQIYVYDMDRQTETLLTAPGPDYGQGNYGFLGWVDNQWILCTKEPVPIEGDKTDAADASDDEAFSRQLVLVSREGIQIPLAMEYDFVEGPRGDGRIVISCRNSKGEPTIKVLSVGADGSTETLWDQPLGEGAPVGEIKISGLGKKAAFLSAPDPDSFERQLWVLNLKDGSVRRMAAPIIGEQVSSRVKELWWLDENRLLVTVAEEWQGQETSSLWVLDLRSKTGTGGTSDPSGAEDSSEDQGSGGTGDMAEAGHSAVERDTVRKKDVAGARDASQMAGSYLEAIKLLYRLQPEMNGAEGEIQYIAVDTSGLINLSEEQKTALLGAVAAEFDAEVLDKSYLELKEEGRLDEQGRFAEGLLYRLEGGYLLNNEMSLSGFKWRSVEEKAAQESITVRFAEEKWSAVQ